MSDLNRPPERGDVMWLSLDPQAGHEQAGRRPVLVISPAGYNRLRGMALVCPISNQKKGYPFEVDIPPGLPVSGVVLSDQLKSIDWKARRGEFMALVEVEIVEQVVEKILPLIDPEGVFGGLDSSG